MILCIWGQISRLLYLWIESGKILSFRGKNYFIDFFPWNPEITGHSSVSVWSKCLSFVVLFAQSTNSLCIFGEFSTTSIFDRSPRGHMLCIPTSFSARAQEHDQGSTNQLNPLDFASGASGESTLIVVAVCKQQPVAGHQWKWNRYGIWCLVAKSEWQIGRASCRERV